MRNKRFEFAVRFGTSPFKSAPLHSPNLLLGLGVPILLVAILAVTFLAGGDSTAFALANTPVLALPQLKEKRVEVFKAMDELRKTLEREKRENFSPEEQEKWDQLNEEFDQLEARIDREEKFEKRKSYMESIEDPTDPPDPGQRATEEEETRTKIFGKWLRNVELEPAERRALQADLGSAGGFILPPEQFVREFLKFVDDEVFIRQFGTVIPVTEADSLGVPELKTDPADADWTSEIGGVTEDTAMNFGDRELRPWPLSKLLKVSMKLLRKAPRVESLVQERLAYKFGITEEKAFMTGSGANQPLGIFTASSNGISTGRDVQTGSATDFTADGVIDAHYTLKEQYKRRARWLLHRDGVKRIRKLKDANNQYLWQPGLAGDRPSTILEVPYSISEYVPNTFTTGLYVGAIGDLSFYWIAEAMRFELQRLVEKYADTNQIGFIGRMELDGMPVLEEAFVRCITN